MVSISVVFNVNLPNLAPCRVGLENKQENMTSTLLELLSITHFKLTHWRIASTIFKHKNIHMHILPDFESYWYSAFVYLLLLNNYVCFDKLEKVMFICCWTIFQELHTHTLILNDLTDVRRKLFDINDLLTVPVAGLSIWISTTSPSMISVSSLKKFRT